MLAFTLCRTVDSPAGTMRIDLSAAIDDGEFVAVFGPSGAGKTTLLRMLAGLATPDGGSIVVNGVTWFDAQRRINVPPQKRSIGFVFQDYALFPNLSVIDNIAYAVGTTDRQWIDELLELTGLAGLRDRLPGTLSGGQKQRVALARAIARRPALLLLDEPLSALDGAMRARLQDDLARLHRRFGMTVLMVSHDIGEVFKLANRVLQIDHGRFVRSGSPAELFLKQRAEGKLNINAQVLAIRREEVIHIVSLLVGQQVVEVVAFEDELRGVQAGDTVSIILKAFSAAILKQ
ncbi:ABC transporter ATP-binding protein [Noviherbaspirillum sp.]|uniref:ABC transporter ATP-binding protein n=1 Tax=Noviherbaspirillum sp. TaxID=1926288 RepID=UPI002FE1AC29